MTAFYITTAIEYANGEPHLGHAFEKIGADAIARYRRLHGERSQLLVGTDDHGLKVARAAVATGWTPADQADHISEAFRRTWDALGIGYATFVRTTTPHHAAGVHALISRIRERHPDAFYERAYEGWYCVGCESFRTTHDLVGGRCPVHPTLEIERVAESNWFFRLSAFQGFLASFLAAHPEFVQPESRRNEIVAFVERGLDDVSITRASLDWGIPFPLPDARGRHQVIYVWFDALPSYLTATGFPAAASSAIAWPAQVHVIGKDITRFHCILWPAVLHAAGLPLPERVWVHGFVTVHGTRLSKTAGVWVELTDAIERYGPDALRYFLLREIPFDADGDFSWARFDARYSADLVNTLGNLVSRVIALIVRHCEGARVPERRSAELGPELEARAARNLERYIAGFDAFRPHEAVAAIWDTLAAANEYITRTAPWALAHDGSRRGELGGVLWTLARLLARQAILLAPIIPGKAEGIWSALGGPASVHDRRLSDVDRLDAGGWRVAFRGHLFPRRPSC